MDQEKTQYKRFLWFCWAPEGMRMRCLLECPFLLLWPSSYWWRFWKCGDSYDRNFCKLQECSLSFMLASRPSDVLGSAFPAFACKILPWWSNIESIASNTSCSFVSPTNLWPKTMNTPGFPACPGLRDRSSRTRQSWSLFTHSPWLSPFLLTIAQSVSLLLQMFLLAIYLLHLRQGFDLKVTPRLWLCNSSKIGLMNILVTLMISYVDS